METESCCNRCALLGRREHDHAACARRRAALQTREETIAQPERVEESVQPVAALELAGITPVRI